MSFLVLILNFLLFWGFALSFLKEFPHFPYFKALPYALFLYFATGFVLQISEPLGIFVFFASPVFLLFIGFFIWQRNKDKAFVLALYKILPSLISQMKLGFSFLDAWQRSLKDVENRFIARKLQEVSDILRFQRPFLHPQKEVTEFVNHLNQARNSSQSLKRLKQLQEKIKVEQVFYRKSARVLMQLRLQSGVLSFLYLSILIWTVVSSQMKHLDLILLSFFFFSIGLFWIFKTGRRMKWSL